jgi:hypothetical protein
MLLTEVIKELLTLNGFRTFLSFKDYMTRPMTIKENNGELPMEMSKNIQTNLAREHLLYGFSVLATS